MQMAAAALRAAHASSQAMVSHCSASHTTIRLVEMHPSKAAHASSQAMVGYAGHYQPHK